jgi:hypothetical protein
METKKLDHTVMLTPLIMTSYHDTQKRFPIALIDRETDRIQFYFLWKSQGIWPEQSVKLNPIQYRFASQPDIISDDGLARNSCSLPTENPEASIMQHV